MTTRGSLANIEKLESDLWEAADMIRNSHPIHDDLRIQSRSGTSSKVVLRKKIRSLSIGTAQVRENVGSLP